VLRGAAKQGKRPVIAELLQRMVALCPDSMICPRDRALLAFGFAGAFRRSELVALGVEDLTEVPGGLRVLIRRSKTDQEGLGIEIAISPRLSPAPDRGGAIRAGGGGDQPGARVPRRGTRREGFRCSPHARTGGPGDQEIRPCHGPRSREANVRKVPRVARPRFLRVPRGDISVDCFWSYAPSPTNDAMELSI